jgi:hypothetical protein
MVMANPAQSEPSASIDDRGRFRPLIIPLVLLASFGPYVVRGAGLRSEHVLLYPLFALAVLMISVGRRTLVSVPPVLVVTALLTANLLWIALVTLITPLYTSFQLVIAQVENMLQPIAVLVVVGTFARATSLDHARDVLRQACLWLVALLVANTLLSVLSMFLDVSAFVGLFLREEEGIGSVWMAAANLGRFTGIFNQPMESGLTYSLGLLAWGYLARVYQQRSVLSYGAVFLMVLGGALGTSKVFLFGGLPLFLLYVFSVRGAGRLAVNARLWLVVGAGVAGLAVLLANWRGRTYFEILMSSSSSWDLLTLVSGGRFGGQETHVKDLFSRVMRESPFFGFGYGAEHMFDSTYLEFVVSGGMVSIFLLAAMFATLGWVGLKAAYTELEEGRLLAAVVVLLVGAGIGAPTVTINRFSTVLWLLVVLIIGAIHLRSHPQKSLPVTLHPGHAPSSASFRGTW